jgi:ankyrin repeat protein
VLLEKGADLKICNKKGGITALGIAALNGKTGAVKLLIEKGSEVNFANDEGKTPLLLAVKNNRLETVKLLLEKGAQANAKDKEGKTALDVARAQNHKDMEQTLLKAGAIAGTRETPVKKKPQNEPATGKKPGKKST